MTAERPLHSSLSKKLNCVLREDPRDPALAIFWKAWYSRVLGLGSRGKGCGVRQKEGHACLKGSSKYKADKVNFGLLRKIS